MASNKKSVQMQQFVRTLQEKKDALLAGRCRLTLTAGLAREICSVLYSSPRSQSIEGDGLLSLLPNIRAIRVTQDDKSLEINPNVNLSPFHHVIHLEVRNVPISSLSGLSKLRSQLKSLVLYGGSCLENLDEALVQCGGDKSQDSFLWSELQSLHATSFPSLDLGSGLHLAPWLKTLDLSFNGLSENSIASLSTLLTLHSLSLNFNQLVKVPSLAPSARSSLKILHLRQNQLDSLRGLELLSGLEELDAAYNCLSSSEALSSLCSLSHLVRLCLESNPISYSKDYRLLVVRRIATSVNKKKFALDGQPLNGPEKDAVGTMASLYSSMTVQLDQRRPFTQLHDIWSPPVRSSVTASSVREETVPEDVERIMASLEDSTSIQQHQTSTPVKNPTFLAPLPVTPATPSSSLNVSVGKQRRKPIRMREVEIVETDQPPLTGALDSPSTPNPTPQQQSQDAVEHLTTKQQLEELRRTFGQDNWLHSQAGNQVRQLLGWKEAEGVPERDLQDVSALFPAEVEDSSVVIQHHHHLHQDEEIVVLSKSGDSPVHTQRPALLEEDSDEEVEEEEPEEETADVHVFLVQRHRNQQQEPVDRLLTVSSVRLSEKDSLTGKTLTNWKRSTLRSLSVLAPSSDTESAYAGLVRFQLIFLGGLGQQAPTYTMEDNDFAELDKLLDIRNGKAENDKKKNGRGRALTASPDELSCMKCDSRFPSGHAALKLRTVQLAANGNGHAAMTPKGQLEEYSTCPHCGSDMIFAVQPTARVDEPDSSDSSSISTGIAALASSSSGGGGSGSDVVTASFGGHRPIQHSTSSSSSPSHSHSSASSSSSSGSSEAGSVEVMDKSLPRPPLPLLSKSGPAGKKSFTLNPHGLKSTSIGTSSVKSGASSVSGKSNGSERSSKRSERIPPPVLAAPVFTYSYADFSQVDHRLRLYCEMFLLSHQSEEFHGLIKAELVVPGLVDIETEAEPLSILLVITSHKLYFLKITGATSEQPEKWLNMEVNYPLSQLTALCPVVGHQGLALKLGPPGTSQSFVLLLRDTRRTKNVAHFLLASLEKSGLVVPTMTTELMATQWSAMDGLVRGHGEEVEEGDEHDGPNRSGSGQHQGVFLFCEVRLDYGGNSPQQTGSYTHAALMVTSDRMALIRGDPRWLLPNANGGNTIHFRRWGLALLSLQQVVNLISLESFVNRPEQLRCYFLDEASSLEEKWTVQLSTREAVDQLIEAVRTPWEAMFSVELEINELDE